MSTTVEELNDDFEKELVNDTKSISEILEDLITKALTSQRQNLREEIGKLRGMKSGDSNANYFQAGHDKAIADVLALIDKI